MLLQQPALPRRLLDRLIRVGEVEALLTHILPNGSNRDWVAVLMARHHRFRGSEQGLALADKSSAGGSKCGIRGNGGMFVCYGDIAHDADIAPWPFDHLIGEQKSKSSDKSFEEWGDYTGKSVEDWVRLFKSAQTDGEKHAATRDIAASAAGLGLPQALTTAIIMHICPVWDANLENSIQSAYDKFFRHDFRHKGLELIRDDKDRPVWNVANAEALLKQHQDWQGVFAYDEFHRSRVLVRSMPGQNTATPRDLTDDDYTMVQAWFQRNGFPKADAQNVIAAVRKVATENTFDPLRGYLNGLKWDGRPRLASWLATYCGVEPSDYTSEVGKRWAISAIARAMKPGCKADCMLVLEGAQGRRKSTALAALAGEDWFSDALPQMGTKDASSYLRGKWIIEVAELEAMRREMDTIKAYISRQVEHYRPAYGREEVSEPRRCVFAGSTNKDDWQRDETGGRRFWPVRVGEIDVPGLKRDRDQLWAEAVTLYRAGERWWLEGDVVEQAQAEVAERAPDDPWAEDVARIVEGMSEVSTKYILRSMDFDEKDMTMAHSKRAAKELIKLGWTKTGLFWSGPFRGLSRYVPPKGGSDEQ